MSRYDFDDFEFLHGRVYDPVKARAYYLRTRQLKGRAKSNGVGTTIRTGRRVAPVSGPKQSLAKSRREEMQAQRAALEKRLDRLREVLEEAVDAAKRRSGVKVKPDKDSKTSTDPKEVASRNERDKSKKPLTASEKAKKAREAREQYEQERQGTGLAEDIRHLQAQVKDIRAKIEKALADSRKKSSRSPSQTASKGR